MRKNSARKWLHATLDLLPVVIIPIFALYATNKNATFAQEITVSQNKVVDFNQKLNIQDDNVSFTPIEYGENLGYYNLIDFDFDQIEGHKYIFKINLNNISNNVTQVAINYNTIADTSNVNSTSLDIDVYSNVPYSEYKFLRIYSDTSLVSISYYNVQLFDLTQMFGAGNEPSLQQFNEWYPNAYYDYTISEKQLLKDYDQITYNDTDIGSQFIYGLYNSVDKYFNIGNVFNLGSIYDWLNLNIFNGNSPIAIYIVWNIVAYEFLMDLLFLLYGLFMFFIDTCTNLMDRFYCNLSGRR